MPEPTTTDPIAEFKRAIVEADDAPAEPAPPPKDTTATDLLTPKEKVASFKEALFEKEPTDVAEEVKRNEQARQERREAAEEAARPKLTEERANEIYSEMIAKGELEPSLAPLIEQAIESGRFDSISGGDEAALRATLIAAQEAAKGTAAFVHEYQQRAQAEEYIAQEQAQQVVEQALGQYEELYDENEVPALAHQVFVEGGYEAGHEFLAAWAEDDPEAAYGFVAQWNGFFAQAQQQEAQAEYVRQQLAAAKEQHERDEAQAKLFLDVQRANPDVHPDAILEAAVEAPGLVQEGFGTFELGLQAAANYAREKERAQRLAAFGQEMVDSEISYGAFESGGAVYNPRPEIRWEDKIRPEAIMPREKPWRSAKAELADQMLNDRSARITAEYERFASKYENKGPKPHRRTPHGFAA